MKKLLAAFFCCLLSFPLFPLAADAKDEDDKDEGSVVLPESLRNAPDLPEVGYDIPEEPEFKPKNAYKTCTAKIIKDEFLSGGIEKGVHEIQKQINQQLEAVNFPIPGTGKAIKNSFIGNILGISDDSPALAPPVRDEDTRKYAKNIALQDCIEDIATEALTTAATRFSRRAMDSIVDGLTDWIQNGGDPRFLDLGTIFREAADAAVGDTLIEVGLGRFCSPLQKVRLQSKLKPVPRFSQRAQCTLTQVVDNLEDFYRDFKTGGWIAYSEGLKPQNNRFGLELMLDEELLRRQAEEERKKELEYTAAGGFKEIFRCHAWQQIDAVGNLVIIAESGWSGSPTVEPITKIIKTGSSLWEDQYLYSAPRELEVDGVPTPGRWQCIDREVNAPPGFVMGATESVLTADTIHRTDPQNTAYADAIGDALINRAFKEGFNSVGLSITGKKAKKTLEDHGVTNPSIVQTQNQQIAEGRALVNTAKRAGSAAEQAEELKKDVAAAFLSADAAEKLLNEFIDAGGNPLPPFKDLIGATGDLHNCRSALLPADNACLLGTASERTEAENTSAQFRGDRTTIQNLRSHLTTITTALSGNPTDGQVVSFTVSVSDITNTFNALSLKYKTLATEIAKKLPEVTAELALCRAPAYTCPR